MREAPSLVLIEELQKKGAIIKAFDPVAEENTKGLVQDVIYTQSPYDTAKGADALMVITEWNEFRNLDMAKVKTAMRSPILIDGRNVYERKEIEAMGFTYAGVGR